MSSAVFISGLCIVGSRWQAIGRPMCWIVRWIVRGALLLVADMRPETTEFELCVLIMPHSMCVRP